VVSPNPKREKESADNVNSVRTKARWPARRGSRREKGLIKGKIKNGSKIEHDRVKSLRRHLAKKKRT